MSSHFVPGTVVDSLHVLSPLSHQFIKASTILSPFVGKETETQEVAQGHIANYWAHEKTKS